MTTYNDARQALKNRLRNGDASAAVLLARSYADENKRKESCVCLRIAQQLGTSLITSADKDRQARFWASFGERVRKACLEKAALSITQIRLKNTGV